MTSYEQYQARERMYANRALQLVGDQYPHFNIAPIIDLVRQADALGFDVVKRDPSHRNPQPA